MNATATAPCSEVLPTKIAKARPREIDSGGAVFITAELLAGQKKLAPLPLMMLASTTTHSPVVTVSWARLSLTRGCHSLNGRGLR